MERETSNPRNADFRLGMSRTAIRIRGTGDAVPKAWSSARAVLIERWRGRQDFRRLSISTGMKTTRLGAGLDGCCEAQPLAQHEPARLALPRRDWTICQPTKAAQESTRTSTRRFCSHCAIVRRRKLKRVLQHPVDSRERYLHQFFGNSRWRTGSRRWPPSRKQDLCTLRCGGYRRR
jgi:hypothetical protein